MKTIHVTIFFCALMLGSFLLALGAAPASSAPPYGASTVPLAAGASSADQQSTQTEQQSMFAPLVIAILGFAVTLTHIIFRRRAKEEDT